MQAHVQQWKKNKVKNFTDLVDQYKLVGIVNMENLPAKQLQRMRETLRENVNLQMTKKTLLRIIFKNSKKQNIDKLSNYLGGMPALLLTNENPFKLFNTLKKNKSKAPIKGGQTAPNDIIVPAGPTDFPPGPIIGELGAFGIVTGVEDGKVAVKKDCTVAKEGEVVDAKLAGVLSRMNIEPMEIGLNLVAIWEDGEILTKDVLDIDTDQYLADLKTCGRWAFNLAMESGFPTQETITLMVAKGHRDALALANAQDILTDETVKPVLAKAQNQMLALKSHLNLEVQEPKAEEKPEAPKEETKEVKTEEKTEEKPEEKKEDVKTEEPETTTESEAPAEAGSEEKTSEPVEEKVEEKPAEPEKKENKEETAEVKETEVEEKPADAGEKKDTDKPAEPES